jgi:RHS repeat-associated protein
MSIGNVSRSYHITQTEDALHHITKSNYDRANRQLIITTDELPDTTIIDYDELGRIKKQKLKGISSADDRNTIYTYNDLLNTTTIARPESVTDTIKRDSRGNTIATSKTVTSIDPITSIVTSLIQTTAYEYNGLNKLTKITDALNNATTYEYDTLGNRISSTATDAQTGSPAHTTYYESNNLGWNTKTTDAIGREFTTTYDAVGNAIAQVETGLRTTTNTYDKLNRQTQVTMTSGAQTRTDTTVYDMVGNIISSTDAENNTTQYQYDALNRRTKTIDAKAQDTDYTYDAVGNLFEVIDTPTRKIVYTYDNLNRRTDVKDAENIVTHTAYNEFGEAIAITQNYGGIVTRTTQYEYDKLGRKQKTIDPLNHVTVTTYDEADNVTSVTDANNNKTQYQYDKLNRQTKVIDANNITTQINTYDGFGNIKSIKDASGNLTQSEYDLLDRLTKTIDPRSKETIQAYDGLGRVLSIKERNARIRTFAYDINDNLTTETWDNGTKLTYAYDKVGNLTSSVDASSNTTNTYGYDAIYQLTSAATSNSTVRFEYDYDEFGDLVQRKDLQGTLTIATLDYTYNNNHQLTNLIQSGVGLATQTIEMSYDKLSQLRKIDRVVASNPGHLVTDYDYDGAGRLFDIKNKFNTNVISNYNYGYDNGNRLNGKSGTDGISTVAYGNDNQISSVTSISLPNESYSFNALGIRSGWVTDTVDKRRVLSDGTYQYQYDDEGNLTQKKEISTGKVTTYVWDYRNRLSRVNLSDGSIVEYGYDAEDRRVGKKINGVTTEKYVYDGDDIALVVNAAGTIVERYLYGDGTDNVLSRVSAGTTVWSLGDRQGSVVDVVDEGGNVLSHFVYDSFGNGTATTSADFRFGYTGRELDIETGLYYYRARYYDSGLGRFISEDPIGFGAGDTNLYRYVNNNPTNYTDPSGKIIPFVAAFLVAGIGAIGTSAAIGGTVGVAKSLANDWDRGQLSWGSIGTALGEGVKGAAIGAAFGFVAAGTIAATAVASPFAAAALGIGLVSYGLYGSATSAYENFSEGRTASGVVDVLTGLLDFRDLTKSVSHGVSTFKESAQSGNWYNGRSKWDEAAWDITRGYESQSSGLTRDVMTQVRQNTLGYQHGELMSNGLNAGMGPGAASRGEFPNNALGSDNLSLETLVSDHQNKPQVFDTILDPWLPSPIRLSDKTRGYLNDARSTRSPTGFKPDKLRKTIDEHYEDQVRRVTGGISQDINGREIDSVTPTGLHEVKRSMNAINEPRKYIKQKGEQIKATILSAKELNKTANFWFKYGVHGDVRKYIEAKGGIVHIGLGN